MSGNRETRGGVRPGVAGLVVGALAVAGLVLWWLGGERGARNARPDARPPSPVAAAQHGAAPEPAPQTPADDARPLDPSEGVFDASALAWSNVDLDELRAALPENSYWERSAPSDDPELLRRREEQRAYWEREYGKVLSNTASEEEVRAYYAHRQQLSSDAIEFSGHLLEHYGDVLPERDVGMLELALKLHMARLEELPRNLSDALARREEHEARRREWLAQQDLFEGDAADASARKTD